MRIRYVENYERIIGDKATALVWQDEIVIDKKYKDTKLGQKLLEHERKHFEYLLPLFTNYSGKAHFKAIIKNNLWDFASIIKMTFLYGEKSDMLLLTLVFACLAAAVGLGLGLIF